MAEAIILEFTGDASLYHKVDEILGTKPDGTGDWPEGLLSHVGASPDGKSLLVFEVWESKAQQEAFMNSRLGAALAQAGAPAPTRVEWLEVLGQFTA
jgi:hypothetical protein